MKNFLLHSLNISWRVLSALFVAVMLSAFVSNIVVVAVTLFFFGLLYVLVPNKGYINKGSYAYAATQADLFNPSQLQVKSIVMNAIYAHYGWKKRDGKWSKDGISTARPIPELLDKLRITRRDLHQVRYLTPTESTFKFFDKSQDPNKPFESNFREASLPANKMMIFFGIVGELATGAGAADTSDILAFGVAGAGDEEFTNGIVSYEINKEKEVDEVLLKSLFVNDDAIKNYFRFPRPIVWEPSNGQALELKLSKAYAAGTHKYGRFTLVGFELTR